MLLKKVQNFVFCECELYGGTAHEQKTESDKNAEVLPSAFFNGWFVVVILRKISAPTSRYITVILCRGYALFRSR